MSLRISPKLTSMGCQFLFCCPCYILAVSIGTSVLQVKANDTDSTKSLQYSIERLSIIAKSTDGTQIASIYPYDYRVCPLLLFSFWT